MEEKTRFIIIALVGLLAISLLVNLHVDGLRKKIEQDKNVLQEENATLTRQIEETQKEIDALKSNVDKLSQEKEEYLKERLGRSEERRKQRESLVKERDELLEKLKAQEAKEIKEVKKESAGLAEDTYWAEVLKTKTSLEMQLEKMRSELKNLQIENEQLQRGKSVSGLELNDVTREKQDLEQQLEYNQKTLDSITIELVREKNSRRQLQDSLKSIRDDNALLRRQLKVLLDRKVNLENKIVQLQEEKAVLARRFNEMELLLEDKYSQLGELKERLSTIRSGSEVTTLPPKKESIELPPIIVRPQVETPTSKEEKITVPLEGDVLAVNKDNNFVIIDLGKYTGIKVGDTFKVYREDEPIATIEVTEVRQNITACDIKKETTPIQIGDIVR